MMDPQNTPLFLQDDTMTEDELKFIQSCIPVRPYKKDTILLREGQISRESYFVLSGCVRSYYLIDGEERTTAFYTENESCANLSSYTRQVPSAYFIACVEDVTLAVLTYDMEQKIIRRVPKFESLCRATVEADFGQHQELMARFITRSPEERYKDLLRERPDLLQRVPQYHLATYLGVKPESLSRIRKRLLQKE